MLAANHGANDQTALAGAHNLYLWQTDAEHPEGHITFLARIINGADVALANSETQTTPDGRYLIVGTSTPLVSSGPDADTDSAHDVYRYDAKTGEWLRLSTDATGSGGNAEISSLVGFRNAMTTDGHTVVFATSEALAPADSNSAVDVYAWHEGQVSLISPDGVSSEDYGSPGISASGTDIFFTTTSQVTAADSDTSSDVYAARVGGGFDLRESGPCEGEGCRRPPSAPPGPELGAGGLGGQGDVKEPAPTFTLRAISAVQRRALAQTGRATVTVTANVTGDGVGTRHDNDQRQALQWCYSATDPGPVGLGAVDVAVVAEGTGAVGVQAPVVGQGRRQSLQVRVTTIGDTQPHPGSQDQEGGGQALVGWAGIGSARGPVMKRTDRCLSVSVLCGREMGVMSFSGLPYRVLTALVTALLMLSVGSVGAARAGDSGSVFELQNFVARAMDADGIDYTVAGGHPHEAVTSFSFPTTISGIGCCARRGAEVDLYRPALGVPG